MRLLLWSTLSLLVLACTRDSPVAVERGELQLAFEHVVGAKPLVLGSTSYRNGGGETFTVSTLNYYVTNIRLKRTDGPDYVVPQDSSYFLIRASDPATQVIRLHNLPAGTYSGVSYLLGVDSLRNTASVDRRTGVLDPAGGHTGGMYWDWNSGYIHFKLEGNSPQVPASAGDDRFMYHIGLFGGYQSRTLNNLRTVTLTTDSTPIRIVTGLVPCVHIEADVQKVFDGPNPLRISQTPLIMISGLSAGVADNYARMFRVTRVDLCVL